MSRKLAMDTTIDDTTYKAGTVPPPEVAERITNPKAWSGLPPSPVTHLANQQARAEAKAVAAEAGEPVDEDDEAQPPAEDFTPVVEEGDPFTAPAPGPEPVPDLNDPPDPGPEPTPKPAATKSTSRKRATANKK